MDEHDVNGYEVYVNNEPSLSCVTATRGHSSSSQSSTSGNNLLPDATSSGINPASSVGHKHKKHNTCFTSAVLYVKQGKYILVFKENSMILWIFFTDNK